MGTVRKNQNTNKTLAPKSDGGARSAPLSRVSFDITG